MIFFSCFKEVPDATCEQFAPLIQNSLIMYMQILLSAEGYECPDALDEIETIYDQSLIYPRMGTVLNSIKNEQDLCNVVKYFAFNASGLEYKFCELALAKFHLYYGNISDNIPGMPKSRIAFEFLNRLSYYRSIK